uniref:Uncharacterized protein n=1 Tax=Globodera rostochiensis TaxID=31243 RepID=A0A914ICU9_GLORO
MAMDTTGTLPPPSATFNSNSSSVLVHPSSHRCLSEQSLRLSAHPVETVFIGFLLPSLIAFGLIGNCLNLCVLLGGSRVHPTTRRFE